MAKMYQYVLCLVVASAASFASPTYPKNCKDLQNQGAQTGTYSIKPDFSPEPFVVFCDMETQNGGWLYFLNRIDGSGNFSVPWIDYKNGFGNTAGEFWLGLDYLHQLTVNEINELLIELVDWNLNKYYINYKTFSISKEDDGYRLQTLGGYSGDLPDSFSYHAGRKFSTIDQDNDGLYGGSCSLLVGGGGWWYGDCQTCKLTGYYFLEDEAISGSTYGIIWIGFHEANPEVSQVYSFKEARMMIRPRD